MTWILSTAKIIAKSTEIKWPNWIQGLIQNFIYIINYIPPLVALTKSPNIGVIILSWRKPAANQKKLHWKLKQPYSIKSTLGMVCRGI